MLRLIDLNYFSHTQHTSLDAVLNMYRPSFGYIPFITDRVTVIPVNHYNGDGSTLRQGVTYYGFNRSNGFFQIPTSTHGFIRKQKPDVILVQGLHFPVQIMILRRRLGKNVKIIVQHHGEQPFDNGIMRWMQKRADKYIDAYLFTALGNASKWLAQGVISSKEKCYEVLEASSMLSRQDKHTAMQQLGVIGNNNFLWVGRLNEGKDPLTVLNGFETFADKHPAAKLYMIYHEDDMLGIIKEIINKSEVLQRAVVLIGKITHDALANWYSACDFFISGSHREGSGYALIECMSCGCIPVVTDIPPFRKIAGDGKLALLFEPGSVNDLVATLDKTTTIDRTRMQQDVLSYYQSSLSFQAIANSIYTICDKLVSNR
ncbi:MAG: glycosyltransferase family 4 protein [Bacteroidetes bacterium]|nr:glycosyltransferase family 4 protein [Bacteroidota bacterium]